WAKEYRPHGPAEDWSTAQYPSMYVATACALLIRRLAEAEAPRRRYGVHPCLGRPAHLSFPISGGISPTDQNRSAPRSDHERCYGRTRPRTRCAGGRGGGAL